MNDQLTANPVIDNFFQFFILLCNLKHSYNLILTRLFI